MKLSPSLLKGGKKRRGEGEEGRKTRKVLRVYLYQLRTDKSPSSKGRRRKGRKRERVFCKALQLCNQNKPIIAEVKRRTGSDHRRLGSMEWLHEKFRR